MKSYCETLESIKLFSPHLPTAPFSAHGLLIWLWIHATTLVGSSSMNFERCLESSLVNTDVFCLPSDYRKDVLPPMSSPVHVYVNLPLSEISVIDDQHSQISMRLYYKLLWPEPRMVLNKSSDWSKGRLTVGAKLIDFFWTPDLIFHDLVRFYKPEMVQESAALQIKKENAVYYKLRYLCPLASPVMYDSVFMTRADLTVVCKGMEFGLYPFDKHVCYLKMTSFGHNTDSMILHGGFTYKDVNQRELSFAVKVEEVHGSTDVYVGKNTNYSMYSLEIHLTRFVTPYLLNVYFPTASFVLMSWVSFIIPIEIIAARVTLLITLCLVLINSFNSATEKIPVAQTETALEFWISACVALVFAALAEYAFILFRMVRLRRILRKKRRCDQDTDLRQEPRQQQEVIVTVQQETTLSSPLGERHLNQKLVNVVVNSQDREKSTTPAKSQQPSSSPPNRPASNARDGTVAGPKWRDTLHANFQDGADGNFLSEFKREVGKLQDTFDENALMLYPTLFFIFNLGYWSYYYIMSRM